MQHQSFSKGAAIAIRTDDLRCGTRLIFINLLLEYLFFTACWKRNKSASTSKESSITCSLSYYSSCFPNLKLCFPAIDHHYILGHVLHDGLQVALIVSGIVVLRGRLQEKHTLEL